MKKSEILANKIIEIAKGEKTEADLKAEFEYTLRRFSEEEGWDIVFRPVHEYTILGTGRPDAVFGHMVIEYEKPGKLQARNDAPGNRETIAQLQKYIKGLATKEGSRIAGVSTDGRRIIFVLPRRDKWQVSNPYPVASQSIQQLLSYMRALARKTLSPDELNKDFGPESSIACVGVNTLFNKVLTAGVPKIETMFKEWDRIFGIVYGEDIKKAEENAQRLAKLYRIKDKISLKPILFAVHTYYALFIKLLAAELLRQIKNLPSFTYELPFLNDQELKVRMEDLEEGSIFAAMGVKNFMEGDFFAWYLGAWDEDIAKFIRDMANVLNEYEPATTTFLPEEARDLLKKLYQYLIPKKLRHDLGEYYTPDWLAERILNQIIYDGDPKKRILDPGCGSGTFLVLVVKRIREFVDEHFELFPDRSQVLDMILNNIVGFELNPLAVITARTNYLMALGDLLNFMKGDIQIPVYLTDSILTPSEYADIFRKGYTLHTTAAKFSIPLEIVKARKIDFLTTLLEECIRNHYREEEFLRRVERELFTPPKLRPSVGEASSLDSSSVAEASNANSSYVGEAFPTDRMVSLGPNEFDAAKGSLKSLYKTMLKLEKQGKNRIWARIIKNAFAPIFVGKFDYVIGNPPWVNWESLASEYRTATKDLWIKYGLFSLRGHEARLGGGKKDLAMLFTYAAMDNYLKGKGKLGFVVTQTLFKTKGAGDGFRRFKLGDKEPIKVIAVDDMVELKPFEEAANRTSVVVLQKGLSTKYPVSYTLWRKKEGAKLKTDSILEETKTFTKRSNLYAKPVNDKIRTSPWITARTSALRALEKVIGKSEYQARAGSYTGGLNGVYWVQVLERRPDSVLIIENLHDVGKKKIKRVQAAIESELIYPLLRGRDVSKWKAFASAYILVAQDPEKRIGYDESWMKTTLPKTYDYLKQFENILRKERKSQPVRDLMEKGPFYSMYAVAQYTFAPYKVVWKYIATDLTCCVISCAKINKTTRVIIPDHRLMLVPFDHEDEAHYLCTALNSSISRFVVKAYAVGTQLAPHILNNIKIPKYNPSNSLHRELSELSMQAHKFAKAEDKEKLKKVEETIDQKAAELWGLTPPELNEIKKSLKELS